MKLSKVPRSFQHMHVTSPVKMAGRSRLGSCLTTGSIYSDQLVQALMCIRQPLAALIYDASIPQTPSSIAIQWNLSIKDIAGTQPVVLYIDVHISEIDLYTALCGWDSRQCPHQRGVLFRVSFIERFHCIVSYSLSLQTGHQGRLLTFIMSSLQWSDAPSFVSILRRGLVRPAYLTPLYA